jgi:hypothetical protein
MIAGWFGAAIAAIAATSVLSAGCGGAKTQTNAPTGDVEPPKKADDTEAKASVKLPGDYVDPVIDGNRHDGTRPFDKHVQDDNDFQGDLDDDGHPDQAVEPAWSCGETCNRSIYVMRNSCGHYVGTIGTRHRYDVGDAKHHGLHDLSGYPTTYEADDTKHCWEVHYEFDGTVYKPLKRRECECAMTETTKRCSPDWEDMK